MINLFLNEIEEITQRKDLEIYITIIWKLENDALTIIGTLLMFIK